MPNKKEPMDKLWAAQILRRPVYFPILFAISPYFPGFPGSSSQNNTHFDNSKFATIFRPSRRFFKKPAAFLSLPDGFPLFLFSIIW